jgi:adenylyl cyclase-associated protein
MSNKEIMDMLKQISDRLGRVEARVGGGGGGGDDDDESGPKPCVIAYDAFLSTKVKDFAAACAKIDANDMGETATKAFTALRAFIDMASQCYRPTDNNELMALAKPMIDQIRKAGDDKNKARRTPLEYHCMAFADALSGSLGWILHQPGTGMPPPAKSIKEAAIDGAMFYINKVRKANKGVAEHEAWVKALLQMLNELMAYAKEWHKAGLSWSFKAQGAKSCSEYDGSAAAPTAPETKKEEAPKAAPVDEQEEDNIKKAALAKNNLFAELAAIDQSSGKTAGLRQTKKVNGKRIVENDKSNVMTEAKKKKIAKMRGLGGTKKKEVAKVKPPVCELRGKKWAIENQVGMCTLDAEKCDKKYSIYIYNCNGATIQVLGKVNMITVDKCTKTNVVFNDVMGGCELVNCKQTKVQANGQCATVAIDKTDGCVVYAGKVCWENLTIVASKSSEMNFSWPGKTDDDAWNEACIPEQYQHKIVDGKVTCEVSDLYTH